MDRLARVFDAAWGFLSTQWRRKHLQIHGLGVLALLVSPLELHEVGLVMLGAVGALEIEDMVERDQSWVDFGADFAGRLLGVALGALVYLLLIA